MTPMLTKLPQRARRLVLWVSAIASIVLASALFQWRGDDALKLTIWIALAAVAGTAKVRFPGVETSYSFGYIVVLAAMGMLSFPEAVLVSLVTALVQCYWRASKRPSMVQVLFNLFNYAISGAVSWQAFHGLAQIAPDLSMPARFAFGSGIFFLLNTGLVSWILALLTGRKFIEVWENSHLLIFPYCVLGSACAAVLTQHNGAAVWLLLALLPLLGILYGSMRIWARRASA